ncbi:MAG: Mrp/NBP35 family ATP-binding protein, partial [Planctomycetota bacterium]
MSAVTEEAILEALKQVHDPDLGQDIVTLGFVKNLKICGGAVGFQVELTTPACPMKEQLKQQAYSAVAGVPGVTAVSIEMTANTRSRRFAPLDVLRGVKNLVAIASGKGGVGKSTATVNLALALAASGARVGILDADIYGPSIPGMLGAHERLRANDEGRAEPVVAHGIKAISVGMIVPPDEAMIWRGPMATHLLMQFLSEVEWGELDYLLLDMPPGTGDVQLTLAQSAPLNGAVIVSTPQDVALRIARKGLRMFQKVNVPILGILENMAGFVCSKCGTLHDIFSKGGGERTARELGVPFLGSIPLDPRLVESGEKGQPLFLLDRNSPGAKAFESAARNLAAQLSIANSGKSTALRTPREIHLLDREPPQILWGDGVV